MHSKKTGGRGVTCPYGQCVGREAACYTLNSGHVQEEETRDWLW